MKFTCETKYPYDFTIYYKIEKGGRLAIRIPAWSRTFKVCINENDTDVLPDKGYLYLDVSDGDTICLTLDDTPQFQYASSKIPALSGKTALCRGPLVYCFEGIDNADDVLSLSLKRGGNLNVSAYDENLLNGIVTISADALRREASDTLYSSDVPDEKPCQAVAVPYYTWGNRGENQMRVWMNETV